MAIEMQVSAQTPMTDRRLGGVHFDDIVAARRLLAKSLTPTPLVTHPLLSQRLGAETHVKLENTVPLGSFKLRGGLHLLKVAVAARLSLEAREAAGAAQKRRSATASGHSAFGVGIGSSATVFQKKGDGLAIYVEPEQIASR